MTEEILLLLCGGLLAGLIGGLLGLGGGIVVMPLLRFVVGLPPAEAAGTCILAVFFTTLGGTYRHARARFLVLQPILPIVASASIAAIAASLAFPALATHGHWIDLGIGIVFSLIAVRMLVEGIPSLLKPRAEQDNAFEIPGSLPRKLGVGAAAGALPGLLGIGTGSILVPALTFLLRAPIKAAMAASLLCFCFTAGISACFKLAQGFVDLELALPICLGTLLGAGLGAELNRRLPSGTLKLVFGTLFLYVSFKFAMLGFGVTI